MSRSDGASGSLMMLPSVCALMPYLSGRWMYSWGMVTSEDCGGEDDGEAEEGCFDGVVIKAMLAKCD